MIEPSSRMKVLLRSAACTHCTGLPKNLATSPVLKCFSPVPGVFTHRARLGRTGGATSAGSSGRSAGPAAVSSASAKARSISAPRVRTPALAIAAKSSPSTARTSLRNAKSIGLNPPSVVHGSRSRPISRFTPCRCRTMLTRRTCSSRPRSASGNGIQTSVLVAMARLSAVTTASTSARSSWHAGSPGSKLCVSAITAPCSAAFSARSLISRVP